MRNSFLIHKKYGKIKILFRSTTKVCTVHKCLSENGNVGVSIFGDM